MTVAVNGGSPSAIGLTQATNPGRCTGDGTTKPITCNLMISAPPGSDTFTFKLYAQNLVNGQEPANAVLLSTYTTPKALTVVAGTANELGAFSLGGVVDSIDFTPDTLTALANGATHALELKVIAKDGSGATIIAPGDFATPIALSVSNDPHHALRLMKDTIAAPSASGTTEVKILYASGLALDDATITASAGLGTRATAHVTPITFALSSSAELVVGGSSRTVTLSEPGYDGAFSVTGAGSEVSVTCNPVNCKPSSAGGAVQLTISGLSPGSALSVVEAHEAVPGTLGLPVIAAPTFYYTGAEQAFVVPAGVTALNAALVGARGGFSYLEDTASGLSAEVLATIPVTPHEILGLFVGGPGSCQTLAGGFNGGGAGGSGSFPGCSGGGATDVRERFSKLVNRVLVAGGGGGNAVNGFSLIGSGGGSGGTPNGVSGASAGGTGGSGGTDSSGGNGGAGSEGSPGTAGFIALGGAGGGTGTDYGGGGGGGGYYGGGGGGNSKNTVMTDGGGAGGGGSSYAEATATNVVMQVNGNLFVPAIRFSW